MKTGCGARAAQIFRAPPASGRKIKKRRVSFQARQQKSPFPYGFGDFCFENLVGFLSGFGDGLLYFCFWSMRGVWKFMRERCGLTTF